MPEDDSGTTEHSASRLPLARRVYVRIPAGYDRMNDKARAAAAREMAQALLSGLALANEPVSAGSRASPDERADQVAPPDAAETPTISTSYDILRPDPEFDPELIARAAEEGYAEEEA